MAYKKAIVAIPNVTGNINITVETIPDPSINLLDLTTAPGINIRAKSSTTAGSTPSQESKDGYFTTNYIDVDNTMSKIYIDGITEVHSNYSYYLRVETIDSSGLIVNGANYNALTYEYDVASLLSSKPTVAKIRFCFRLKMGNTESDNVAITADDVADLLIYATYVSN